MEILKFNKIQVLLVALVSNNNRSLYLSSVRQLVLQDNGVNPLLHLNNLQVDLVHLVLQVLLPLELKLNLRLKQQEVYSEIIHLVKPLQL